MQIKMTAASIPASATSKSRQVGFNCQRASVKMVVIVPPLALFSSGCGRGGLFNVGCVMLFSLIISIDAVKGNIIKYASFGLFITCTSHPLFPKRGKAPLLLLRAKRRPLFSRSHYRFFKIGAKLFSPPHPQGMGAV